MENHSRTSRHHIFNKIRGGTWHPDNIVKMKNDQHEAWHLMFGNKHPAEAVAQILDMFGNALNEEPRIKIAEAVKEEDVRYYIKSTCIYNHIK